MMKVKPRNVQRVLGFALTTAGLLALASCSAGDGIEGGEDFDVDAVDQEVGNGLNAGTCAWPTSTWIGNCTATLVHPRLVIFAAHCGANHSYVNFGETSNGIRVSTTRCRTNPGYSGAGNDWAYCILSRDIDLPITPALPRSCGESVLNSSNARVVLAGFGAHQSGSAGIKRWNWADVRRVNWSGNVLELGYGDSSTPATGCPGDSGGPAFVRMGDGTWWTAGIASTLIGACGGTSSWNQYSLVPGAIGWVEQDSGIDITPCHDSAGNWAPTAACRNIYAAAPGSGAGNWSTNPWCQGTPAAQQPTTCGGTAPPPPPPSGGSALRVRHSGKCMDVNASGTADGTNIQQWTCNGSGAQSFRLDSLGNGAYRIVNANSNKCVDVSGASTVNGANVHLWTCNGTGAQSFRLEAMSDGYHRIVNTNSNRCLDVSGGSSNDGANIHQWDCHTGGNQQWQLPALPRVQLFQHCNYSGWQASLAPGDYTTAQLTALGAVNNDASSLQIPAGLTVTLYDGDNFTGTSVTLTANTSCLVGNNFNDRLSSMRIR